MRRSTSLWCSEFVHPPQEKRPSRGGNCSCIEVLKQVGRPESDLPATEAKFAELRALYEPFLLALANHFVLTLPPVMVEKKE